MKLFLALAFVYLSAQEPNVLLERSDDGGRSWSLVFFRPVSSGWMGIAVRDTVHGTVQLYRVRWPQCGRIGE